MRIGCLGAGRIGCFHAQTLRSHPDVDELVIYDPQHSTAVALAEQVGGKSADAVAGVFEQRPDAVVIAAATAAHAELVETAAKAGVPVFCEKPLALDVSSTKAVIDAAAASGIPLQVGLMRRFDPGVRRAREAVRAGALGTVHSIRAVTCDPAPPPARYVPTSGGLFRDCHIHDFDAIRWVTGREVESVHAWGANKGADFFREAGDVDTSAAVLRLDDGALVTVSGTRYNGAGYDVRLEVAGTEGMVAAGLGERSPLCSAEGEVAWPGGEPWRDFLDRYGPVYGAELGAFLDLARGRVDNPCSGEESLEALYIAEACDLSRREGRTVHVQEVRR